METTVQDSNGNVIKAESAKKTAVSKAEVKEGTPATESAGKGGAKTKNGTNGAGKAVRKPELTLDEIRHAIIALDRERTAEGLDDESRLTMEESCLALRQAERTAIHEAESNIVKGFDKCTNEIKLQAKEIRRLVTRMNRIPKVLDNTETAIKECVKVLKAIAAWTMMLCMLLLMPGCASMTKAQLKRVNSLATLADSAKVGPGMVFEMLGNVRQERGMYYSASLASPETRLTELNAIVAANAKDESLAAKADVPQKLLTSYINALKSLSSENRWRNYGIEIRGIGRNMDSVFIAYNKLDWIDEDDRLETGKAKQAGKSVGWLTEQYSKRRQRYIVKKVLTQGDSIVSACCSSLISILKDTDMTNLIDYEDKRIEDDFRAYLMSAPERPGVGMDRDYIRLKSHVRTAGELRRKSISWLQSLSRAHHTLLEEMDRRATYSELSDALFELSAQSNALYKLLRPN